LLRRRRTALTRPHRPPQRRKGKLPLGPLMIGFFIFVVVGSSARRRRRRHTHARRHRPPSHAQRLARSAGMFSMIQSLGKGR